jgi:hypothetical protein
MTTLNIHRIPKFVVNIATVIAHGGFNIGVAHHHCKCPAVSRICHTTVLRDYSDV